MSKKYLFIVLSLWSFAISATPDSPARSVAMEGRGPSRDSIKTNQTTIHQLTYLQQLKTLRMTPLVSTPALINTRQTSFNKNASTLERSSKMRAFPPAAARNEIRRSQSFRVVSIY